MSEEKPKPKRSRKTRNKREREYHLVMVRSLHIRGKNQSAIAVKLGISQQQVSYDIKKINAIWRQTEVNYAFAKAREEAHIFEIENSYWEAWERSLEDDRWLKGVERCVELRMRLLGIESPIKISSTDPTGQKTQPLLSFEQRLRLLSGYVTDIAAKAREHEVVAIDSRIVDQGG